ALPLLQDNSPAVHVAEYAEQFRFQTLTLNSREELWMPFSLPFETATSTRLSPCSTRMSWCGAITVPCERFGERALRQKVRSTSRILRSGFNQCWSTAPLGLCRGFLAARFLHLCASRLKAIGSWKLM